MLFENKESLSNFIEINTHYTRSVNLERDAQSVGLIKTYLPTTRALQTLQRIVQVFNHNEQPRAYTLTGPYGSGKSIFALFLAHLLNHEISARKVATQILVETDAELAEHYQKFVQTNGCLTILLTGNPSPLGKQLLKALYQGALNYWQDKIDKPTDLIEKIRLASESTYSVNDILGLVTALQRAVADSHGQGMLIIIDELGKFLEYEARHPDINEIFLLQGLAEYTATVQGVPLLLVVLLHQAFEHYARGVGERLKNEWQKIGGRFEGIAFLESTEQILRIVQKTFTQKLDIRAYPHVVQTAQQSASVLAQAHALPSAMDEKTANQLFLNCYPLHPVTLLLLPTLCQKMAQNERSLFSYLGSQEPSGFREILTQLTITHPQQAWILPHHIYEYFSLNQSLSGGDYLLQRSWIEIVTALDRLNDATLAQVNLLKTIGLLNLIGSQAGFKSSQEVLGLCDDELTENINYLQSKSVITFRAFNKEYRVWQGSDFDLPEVLQDTCHQLGRLELAEKLNESHLLLPVIARRHTFETGALRYFVPYFLDIDNYKRVISQYTNSACILLFIVETPEDNDLFKNKLVKQSDETSILACLPEGGELRRLLTEVEALKHIGNTEPSLNHDPVARREHQIYLKQAELQLQKAVKNVLEHPEKLSWYRQGKHRPIENRRILQNELSRIMGEIYAKSPKINNELINRSKLSGTIASARNKLLTAMLTHSNEFDLGIEKFPPEKSIYRSVFFATGLHRESGYIWQFSPINKKNDPCHLFPVWERIEKFFADSEKHPQAFNKLINVLLEKPYGVKAGLIPLLLVSAYLIHQHELALYEDGVFVPYFRPDVLDRLRVSFDQLLAKDVRKERIRKEFTVQRFRMEGINREILQEYVKLLSHSQISSEPDLLAISRPLLKFMRTLPDYTRNTQNLSDTAKAVRQACFDSSSPHTLLLQDLPTACGFGHLTDDTEKSLLQAFSQQLLMTLRELNNCYPQLLRDLQQDLQNAFKLFELNNLKDLQTDLVKRAKTIEEFAHPSEFISLFIKRLLDTSGTEQQWLERIFAILTDKPTDKWTDEYLRLANQKLNKVSNDFIGLEIFKLECQKREKDLQEDTDFILISIRQKGQVEKHDVAYLNNVTQQEAKNILEDMNKKISTWKKANKDTRLALLALLADIIIENSRK